MDRVICTEHFDKVRFHTKLDADNHIKTHYSGRNFQSYPCPAVPGHFHVRNESKRNRNKRRKRSRDRNRGELEY